MAGGVRAEDGRDVPRVVRPHFPALQPPNWNFYYWDSDSTKAGFGSTDGTWGTDAFWSTVAAGTGSTANTTTTELDEVFFGTAANGYTGGRTVTVNGAQNGRLLTFGAASGSVTLASGTISLGGGGGINYYFPKDSCSDRFQNLGERISQAPV